MSINSGKQIDNLPTNDPRLMLTSQPILFITFLCTNIYLFPKKCILIEIIYILSKSDIEKETSMPRVTIT